MTDVAPELLKKINNSFDSKIADDKEITEFTKKLSSGKATQFDTIMYNRRLAGHASTALSENIVPEALPDGKLYYNIANRTVTPTIKRVDSLSIDAMAEVTKEEYEKLKIGISPQSVEVDEERINSYINKLVEVQNAGDMEKFSELLNGPLQNICESIIDDYIDAQAKFVEEAGMKAQIIRYPLGKCCKWCDNLAGTYDYKDAPKDIYRRHDNCDCVVMYRAEKVFQDVWTKKKYENEKELRIAREKKLIADAEKSNNERAARLREMFKDDL